MAVVALAREREPLPLPSIFIANNEVVARAVSRKVAVGHGRLDQALGLDPIQPGAQPRASLGLDQFLVGRPATVLASTAIARTAARRLEPPLAHERGPLVQVGRVVGQLDALDHPGAQERRGRHRVVRCHVRAGRHGLVLGQPQPGRGLDPAGAQRGQLGARLAPPDRHERVHQPQSLERVAGVAHLAVEQPGQVLLHVGPGERGTAEHHRPAPGQPARVQLGQVVPHDHGGLHQQPGHPDDVGAVLAGRLEDGRDRLLDADVDHVVAIVGQDDVDQVLADVVHVALDRGQHDPALAVRHRTAPCAAPGSPRRSSSPRPTAARTAAASGRSRTARRRSSCRPAACR